jgi:hypothetical protein
VNTGSREENASKLKQYLITTIKQRECFEKATLVPLARHGVVQ